MKEFKGIIITLLAGACAVICCFILSQNLVNYRKAANGSGLSATGSANCDFEADLVVWRGSFSRSGQTIQDAYGPIKNDVEMVRKYLLGNGVKEDEIVFGSVSIGSRWESEYDQYGNRTKEYISGYDLYQNVSITSTDIDKIEGISRDISGLLASGVQFTSENPEYYYTKLDDLKLQLIAEATENAKNRIDLMAQGSGAAVSKLLEANLGVFQITAQNSDTEYSYGGYYDTTSRKKTASITVRLNYSIE